VRPRQITDADLAYWSEMSPRRVTMSGPGEVEAGIEPCPAIVTDGGEFGLQPVVRVAWELDEIELARLATGGTLWLSTWGGLPVHMLEVAS
jgi:hypothetical protein